MTAEATEETADRGPVEEHYYRRGDIDFCFLLNRTHHNLRVFDYRVGNYQQKRDFFDRIARAESLKKVFTVVEKQDSKSWRSVGFSREGAIPGYFRTADAYIMSRVYTEDGDPIQGGAPKLSVPSVPIDETPPEKPRGLTFELVNDQERLTRLIADVHERAIYAPFRRGEFRPDIALHAKQGQRNFWIGAELDTSFGHVKLDLLSVPEKDTDVATLAFCLHTMLDELRKLEMASVFSLVPADWVSSAQVYVNQGFKVTARLTDHIRKDDAFAGIQLWHRRIANTQTPRLPSFI